MTTRTLDAKVDCVNSVTEPANAAIANHERPKKE